MLTFSIIAAVLVVIALLFVLFPLLRRSSSSAPVAAEAANISIYRDQMHELEADVRNGVLSAEQAEQAKLELEQRLLEDVDDRAHPAEQKVKRNSRLAGAAIGIAIPVMAIALYLQLGNPHALIPQPETAKAGTGHVDRSEFERMVNRLASRMQENPSDPTGWTMLGRSYMVLGQYQKAADAYSRATALAGNDAQLWADYADALAMANNGKLAGKPVEMLVRALKIDPENPKALALAGSAAFEAKQYTVAATTWEKLLSLLPKDADIAVSVQNSIGEARALAAASGASGSNESNAVSKEKGAVSGTVTLSPDLAGKFNESDTLFIFARAVNGPKMPLAIVKLKAGALPVEFSLDDAQSMSPAMKISSFSEVTVGARISRSGNAIPASGDLEGSSLPVKVGSNGVKIIIDRVVP